MKNTLLLISFVLLLFACGKEEKRDPGYYYNVDLSSDVISCDYGESRMFVIKSEDDFYISVVKLYDASGSSCKMLNSDDTFSMITDPAISGQYDSPIPYTVSGRGYSITQTDNHTITISIESEMNYRRIWIIVDAKNTFCLPTPIMFIRPDDPDYSIYEKELLLQK